MSFDAGPQVAVEFDLYSDEANGLVTFRLCNRGPLFSSSVPSESYEPRLITPMLLGTAISVQSYGQPMRALANQGSIEFVLDDSYSTRIFGNDIHWIGRVFRVYEGQQSARGFVEDLDLVFSGRVTDVTHDTKRATIRTGDASTDLDAPLVTELYPADALASIAGKPRPQIWGTVFCIEPVLEDDINLVYRLSRTAVIDVTDLRVGGIPWGRSSNPIPGSGEWYLDASAATITLGSVTLGGDVRCDVIGTSLRGIGDLVTQIVQTFLLETDATALNAMDDLHPFAVGYFAREPVNALSALDDIVTGAGCWWGMTPTASLTAGFIEAPSDVADVATPIDSQNTESFQLGQMLPPAWRLRVEFERHWQTEGQFFENVDETEKQRWAATGLVVTKEDVTHLYPEPRAFDVPAMRSVCISSVDAIAVADLFWNAWGKRREIYDVTAWIDPREIGLYKTATVGYMMVNKNCRIISASRSIGGGPAQLQLWG